MGCYARFVLLRDPEEAEKEEQARQEAILAAKTAATAIAPAGKVDDSWGGNEEMTTDWANEPVPAMAAAPAAAPTSDWASEAPAAAENTAQWGGSSTWN